MSILKTCKLGIVVGILFLLTTFISPAYAEYVNGNVIFAEDLPVGEILYGFTVSGNGASSVWREAVVVQSGQSPRLVLTANHGSDSRFGSDNNYNISTLKSIIDSLSFSINNHITNISAPDIIDVTGGFSGEDYGNVFLQELRTGNYWTRSPSRDYGGSAFHVYSDGRVCGYSVGCSSGVRPAFNLKSETVLYYENGKFRITTEPAHYSAAFEAKYGDLYVQAKAAKDWAHWGKDAADAAKTAANTASTNASAAKTSADAASTNASAAKTEAINAKNAANTASSRVWDTTESKSAATLAKEARDKANTALAEITNVKNTVSSIQSSIGPEVQKIQGLNGATCTTGTTFSLVVQASNATQYRARVDSGSWSGWLSVGSSATVSGITGTGAHTIYVEAQNASGVVATGQMTMFKL